MSLTLERLREVLAYNARTGDWTWLRPDNVPRGFNRTLGAKAGSIDKLDGYRIIGVDGEQYRSSRLIYFYVYGEWPPYGMDHIDRNRSNDAWCNLRPATVAENNQNRPNLRDKNGRYCR